MPFRTIHWRKFFFAAAAIALIAATLVPTEASAEVGDGAARRSGWVWGSDCQPPIRITGVRTTAMAMVRATANAGYGNYGAATAAGGAYWSTRPGDCSPDGCGCAANRRNPARRKTKTPGFSLGSFSFGVLHRLNREYHRF